jgi:hypothetical protein
MSRAQIHPFDFGVLANETYGGGYATLLEKMQIHDMII